VFVNHRSSRAFVAQYSTKSDGDYLSECIQGPVWKCGEYVPKSGTWRMENIDLALFHAPRDVYSRAENGECLQTTAPCGEEGPG
jgi:hypothetical protein